MSNDQATEIKPRKVGFPLGVGIFFLPFIFAWFTLRKGYGRTTRFVSLGWMGLGVAFWALAAIGGHSDQGTSSNDASTKPNAPSTEQAAAASNKINYTSNDEKLIYENGKCVAAWQLSAFAFRDEITSGRRNTDEMRTSYEFLRRRAAYWAIKNVNIIKNYKEEEQARLFEISNKFFNEEMRPLKNGMPLASSLQKGECAVSTEDMIAFADAQRAERPNEEDPVGQDAADLHMPALD